MKKVNIRVGDIIYCHKNIINLDLDLDLDLDDNDTFGVSSYEVHGILIYYDSVKFLLLDPSTDKLVEFYVQLSDIDRLNGGKVTRATQGLLKHYLCNDMNELNNVITDKVRSILILRKK
jgi:hypothetical protein